MELEVIQLNKTDKVDKNDNEVTVYKCVLKGETADVKAKLTLESEDPAFLEHYVTQIIGAKRDLALRPLNHTLDDFIDDPKEAQPEQQESKWWKEGIISWKLFLCGSADIGNHDDDGYCRIGDVRINPELHLCRGCIYDSYPTTEYEEFRSQQANGRI